MLPRSKLVRDPGSFGYRRLLPFLNEMAKNDNARANSKEFSRSHSGLVDESVDGTHGGADPVDSVELLVVKTGGDEEMKDCSDGVKEETKIVNGDLASSKPWLTRCTRSKFVHHPSSFSYKRMLPFLMENEISSQEGDRVKFRRVSEEKQLTLDENDVLANGHHPLAISKDSPEEYPWAEVERTVEEKTSISDGNYVLNGGQLQSAVAEVSPLDGSTAEVQKVTQQVLASGGDPLSSDKGELTLDRNDVLSGGRRQLAVSENSIEERNVAEVERIVEEKATKSDDNSVLDGSHLQPIISEVSPHEAGTAQMQKAKAALTSDGDEASGLTSDKGEFLAKEQPQLCDTEELLKDNAELAEVQQCQSSESGCPDVGFDSPTKMVMVDGGAEQHGALERQDSMASLDGLLPDVGMIYRPSDPRAIGTPLSADEMSGCVMHADSGSRKVGTLRPCGAPCKKLFPFNGAHCLEKQGLSPKKLSPKKGILKRHTRGCKGICVCLDCSIFRLRADRAFEFSRKQMQEADNIIRNLLTEVASLRSLTDKASGQEELVGPRNGKRTHKVMLTRLLTLAAHALAEAETRSEPKDLWREPINATLWRPCSDQRDREASSNISSSEGTNGYIMISANGGINQQRVAICNAVTISRLLNATLVIPKFLYSNVWLDKSQFGDIYQEDYFINYLKSDIRIVKELPVELQSLDLEAIGSLVNDTDVMKEAKPSLYVKQILPILLKNRVVHFVGFGNRLSFDPIPFDLQRLRCRCNFHALRFVHKIQETGALLVERLHGHMPHSSPLQDNLLGHFAGKSVPDGNRNESSKYLAVHLRFEIDMVAYSMCYFGGGKDEIQELETYRQIHFPALTEIKRTTKLPSAAFLRSEGKCPLAPEEAVLMLAAIGFKRSTNIYIAGAEIYGGRHRMAAISRLYPALVTKETLLSPAELEPFRNFSSQLAALDFIACAAADAFAMTDSGSQFSSLVQGYRMYYGGGDLPTIRPNKRRLASILVKNATIEWNEFEARVKKLVQQTKQVHERPVARSIFRHPRCPECMCRTDN